MMQFVQAVPQAAGLCGDLIAEAQDWPKAEAIAERLKKMLPPQLQPAVRRPRRWPSASSRCRPHGADAAAAGSAVNAELDLKKAQTSKAMADAGMAQFQLASATGQLNPMIEQTGGARVTQLIVGQQCLRTSGREWHPLDNPHRQQGQP
jgi:hypothetical protein